MPTLTASTSVAEILPQNLLRKSFNIHNNDTAITVFIKRERGATVSSTDHDFPLGPGANMAMNSFLDGTAAIQERYSCIAASGTPLLSWFETEDVKR